MSGAFDKLADQVRRRMKQASMGFSAEPAKIGAETNLRRDATTRDFANYRMEPDFIGRLPVRVVCDLLIANNLFEFLKCSEGRIIRQYERAFRAYGGDVFFEAAALRLIAARAELEKTGARGLLTVCEQLLRDFKYELPDSAVLSCTVNEALVMNPANALAARLETGHAEKERALLAIVERSAERFRAHHEIDIHFETGAAETIVKRAPAEGGGVRELCETLFTNCQFGLPLIRKNSGRQEFEIPVARSTILTRP